MEFPVSSFVFRDIKTQNTRHKTFLRGQVSLELLITVAAVIAFTVPVLFLLLSVSSVGHENAAKDQADATARTLADSINIVYSQGEGAKRTVLLNLPSNTESLNVTAKEVIVNVKLSSGTYEAASPFFAQMNNTFFVEGRSGLYPIVIETSDKGKVGVQKSPEAG